MRVASQRCADLPTRRAPEAHGNRCGYASRQVRCPAASRSSAKNPAIARGTEPMIRDRSRAPIDNNGPPVQLLPSPAQALSDAYGLHGRTADRAATKHRARPVLRPLPHLRSSPAPDFVRRPSERGRMRQQCGELRRSVSRAPAGGSLPLSLARATRRGTARVRTEGRSPVHKPRHAHRCARTVAIRRGHRTPVRASTPGSGMSSPVRRNSQTCPRCAASRDDTCPRAPSFLPGISNVRGAAMCRSSSHNCIPIATI